MYTPVAEKRGSMFVEEVTDLLDRGTPAYEIPQWYNYPLQEFTTRLWTYGRDVAMRWYRALAAETRDALTTHETPQHLQHRITALETELATCKLHLARLQPTGEAS